MKMNKVLSAALAVAMVATMGTSVFAAPLTADNLADASLDFVAGTIEIDGATVNYAEYVVEDATEVLEGDASSVVVVNAEATNFIVTVPFALHINMDADAVVTMPDSMETGEDGTAKIHNGSASGAVKVTDVAVVGANDWAVATWEDDFANKKVNTKEFGIKINGLEVETDGSLRDFAEETEKNVVATLADDTLDAKDIANHTALAYDDYASITGDRDAAFPVINNGSILPIYYEGKLPASSATITDAVVGGVVFTLDFNTVA